MCLDTIDRKSPNPVGKGYKVFRIYSGKLYPLYARTRGDYPLRRWIKASDQKIRHTDYCFGISDYKPGFHIYTNKSDAKESMCLVKNKKSFCIKRVEYRKAHTSGTIYEWQIGAEVKTIVAEEMRIQK